MKSSVADFVQFSSTFAKVLEVGLDTTLYQHSICDFLKIFPFSKILILNSFGISWGRS